MCALPRDVNADRKNQTRVGVGLIPGVCFEKSVLLLYLSSKE